MQTIDYKQFKREFILKTVYFVTLKTSIVLFNISWVKWNN